MSALAMKADMGQATTENTTGHQDHPEAERGAKVHHHGAPLHAQSPLHEPRLLQEEGHCQSKFVYFAKTSEPDFAVIDFPAFFRVDLSGSMAAPSIWNFALTTPASALPSGGGPTRGAPPSGGGAGRL